MGEEGREGGGACERRMDARDGHLGRVMTGERAEKSEIGGGWVRTLMEPNCGLNSSDNRVNYYSKYVFRITHISTLN